MLRGDGGQEAGVVAADVENHTALLRGTGTLACVGSAHITDRNVCATQRRGTGILGCVWITKMLAPAAAVVELAAIAEYEIGEIEQSIGEDAAAGGRGHGVTSPPLGRTRGRG